jgi:3-oxoacyl-[acyl-carrier-protein] synthase II
MKITVQGLGVVGGFGCGLEAFREALDRGESQQGSVTVTTAAGETSHSVLVADTNPLDRFVPKRTQRRMDHFSRMALLGAYLAMEDAGLTLETSGRLGIVIASGHGPTGTTLALIDSVIEGGDVCSSPIHFAGSLHNSPAANIAILLGIKGPCLTVSNFDLSVASALMTARTWLQQGQVDRVLFGAVDELSPLMDYLWARKGELDAPLCAGALAEGAVPGEGAAFLVLSGREETQDPYCTLDLAYTGRGPVAGAGERDLTLGLGTDRDLQAVWGVGPAGPGFDLAAAAVLLKDGKGGAVSCLSRAEAEGFGVARFRR